MLSGAAKTSAPSSKMLSGAAKTSAARGKKIDVSTLPSTAKRSVSLAFLSRFTEHFDLWDKSTVEVVKNVIVPATAEAKCCWSELPPEQSLLRFDATQKGTGVTGSAATARAAELEQQFGRCVDLGPPQLFVSHAWTTPRGWGLLVTALEQFARHHGAAPEKLTVWVDVFVLNQHNYMNELQQLDQVIEVCANFVQVLDSREAVPLRRVWCLYEVVQRLRHRKPLVVVVGELEFEAAVEKEGGTEKGGSDGAESQEIAEKAESGESPSAAPAPCQQSKECKVSVSSPSEATAACTGTASAKTKVKFSYKEASKAQVEKLLKTVDMQKAQASYPEDVDKIIAQSKKLISGGFAEINRQVREALYQKAILSVLNQAAKQGSAGGVISASLGAGAGMAAKATASSGRGAAKAKATDFGMSYASLE